MSETNNTLGLRSFIEGTASVFVAFFLFVAAILIAFCVWISWGNSHPFFSKIEQQLSSSSEGVLLSDLTDFEWDRVCFFSKADSAPNYSVYDTYKQELGKIAREPMKKRDYEKIIVFFNKNQIVEQYGDTKSAHLRVNGKVASWQYDGKFESHASYCASRDLRLIPTKHDKFLNVNLTVTEE